MMISLNRAEIEALIDLPTAAAAIEDAYRAASRGEVNLPPVGHIIFPELSADCHIKYGHLRGAPTFVIKVATGFPQNATRGLPTGNGLVLVISAATGAVEAMLHDEMVLTDVRTGIGGAIASRLMARENSQKVLITGTGPQAQRQVEAHAALLSPDISFELWGRNADSARQLVEELQPDYPIALADDLGPAVARADIIVTATSATTPFIMSEWVQPGTHITAVGADAPGKQELATGLVARADVVAVDLASQCLDHGETAHAAKAGLLKAEEVREIGTLLARDQPGRTSETQITIADLTGIAAQDIAMANAVLERWKRG